MSQSINTWLLNSKDSYNLWQDITVYGLHDIPPQVNIPSLFKLFRAFYVAHFYRIDPVLCLFYAKYNDNYKKKGVCVVQKSG